MGQAKPPPLIYFLVYKPHRGPSLHQRSRGEPNTKTRHMIAYIPEVVQLYGNMNGLENIAFFSQLAGFNYTTEQLEDLLLKAGLKKKIKPKNSLPILKECAKK